MSDNQRRLSRRQFLRFGVLGAGVVILAACAPKPAPASEATAKPAEAQAAATEAPKATEPPAPTAEPAASAKEVHCWLGMHHPTEWTSRSAEHPTVVNSTRILAKKFEEQNPGVTIVFDEGPGGDDYFAWLSASAVSGKSPDLVWTSHNYAVQNGFAVPMEEYLNQPNPYASGYKAWRDIFYPAYMESLKQPDGHEYCAPLNAIWPNIEVGLAYNRDMLDQMGLKPPRDLE